MPNYVRGASPIWYFPNVVGMQLDDTYWAFFLTNDLPYLPQAVYQDFQALTVWANAKVQFQPDGTLPNNIFFTEGLPYRIEIRKGFTQQSPLIRLIENYIAGESSDEPVDDAASSLENQFTNSQFSQVYFTTPNVITVAGTYNIAPGWFLDLVGTGTPTCTLSQLNFSGIDGNEIPNYPPTGLEVNATGWSSVTLRQRLKNNGALWTGKFVAISVTGQSGNVPQNIQVLYIPNSPGLPQTLLQGTLTPASFTTLANPTLISIPSSNTTDAIVPLYQQETTERTIDHEFNVYRNSIIIQPKNSLLAGWNFRQNPYQFINTSATVTLTPTPVYVADQTIASFSDSGNAVLNITPGSSTIPFGWLQITALNNTVGQLMILQYIDGATIRGWWDFFVSVLVRARLINTSGTSNIKLKCVLFTCNAIPAILSAGDPITGFNAVGDPVFAPAYTARTPMSNTAFQNSPAYPLQNNFDPFEAGNVCPAMAFNKINLGIIPSSVSFATLGVMLYTVGNLTLGDSILLQSAALVPNEFAIDDSPKTFDEVLRQCQYYYEKSYDVLSLPGTVTLLNAPTCQLSSTVAEGYGLDRPFKVTKRSASGSVPTVTWYSTLDGSINNISFGNPPASNDVVLSTSYNGTNSTGIPTFTTPLGIGIVLSAQWTADARLGV